MFIPDGLLNCLFWNFDHKIINMDEFYKGGRLFNFNKETHDQISTLTHEMNHYYHFLTTAVGLSFLLTLEHTNSIGTHFLHDIKNFSNNQIAEISKSGLKHINVDKNFQDEWWHFKKLQNLYSNYSFS